MCIFSEELACLVLRMDLKFSKHSVPGVQIVHYWWLLPAIHICMHTYVRMCVHMFETIV